MMQLKTFSPIKKIYIFLCKVEMEWNGMDGVMIYEVEQTMKGQYWGTKKKKVRGMYYLQKWQQKCFFPHRYKPNKRTKLLIKKNCKKVFRNASFSNDVIDNVKFPKGKAGGNLTSMVSVVDRCHPINEYLTKRICAGSIIIGWPRIKNMQL